MKAKRPKITFIRPIMHQLITEGLRDIPVKVRPDHVDVIMLYEKVGLVGSKVACIKGVPCQDTMLYTKEMNICREIHIQAERTQIILARYMSTLLLNLTFSPLAVARSYSRSHIFLMFHESMSI